MKHSNSLKVAADELEHHEPITDTQEEAFKQWKAGHNLVLSGCAGTGKTFIAMYLALKEVMNRPDLYRQLIIIRSIVPTREIGFLPGGEDEKKQAYTIPYRSICYDLFGYNEAWPKLVTQKKVKFDAFHNFFKK